MNESRQPEYRIVYILLGIIPVLFMLRLPVFGIILFRVLLIGSVFLCFYLLFWLAGYLRGHLQRKAFNNSTEGRIRSRILNCRNLLDRNRAEMEEIRQNVSDLKAKLQSTPDIMPQHQRESGEILKAFQSELNLRLAKAAFYQSCIRKLEGMLNNHLLAREIEVKKTSLRKLQENNFEELAKMEEIKTDLEMDSHYLDTIEELSGKMVRSTTVDDAEHLRLELEQMTRELEGM